MRPLVAVLLFSISASAAAQGGAAKPAAKPAAKKAATAAVKYPPPPLPVYSAAQYSPKASLRHQEDRDAHCGWAFASQAPFEKVSAFYKKRVGENVVAESESKGLYLAILPKSELRVQQGAKGWVWILMAQKDVPAVKAAPGAPGVGEMGEGGRIDPGPGGDDGMGEAGEGALPEVDEEAQQAVQSDPRFARGGKPGPKQSLPGGRFLDGSGGYGENEEQRGTAAPKTGTAP